MCNAPNSYKSAIHEKKLWMCTCMYEKFQGKKKSPQPTHSECVCMRILKRKNLKWCFVSCSTNLVELLLWCRNHHSPFPHCITESHVWQFLLHLRVKKLYSLYWQRFFASRGVVPGARRPPNKHSLRGAYSMSAYFREHPTPRALPWMKHSREICFLFSFFPCDTQQIPVKYHGKDRK